MHKQVKKTNPSTKKSSGKLIQKSEMSFKYLQLKTNDLQRRINNMLDADKCQLIKEILLLQTENYTYNCFVLDTDLYQKFERYKQS